MRLSIPSLSLLLLLTGCATAESPRPGRRVPESAATATFAGGCFWCIESAFDGVPGVHEAVSGYTGGEEPSPTYKQVSSGRTGHTEAVRVRYDLPRCVRWCVLARGQPMFYR